MLCDQSFLKEALSNGRVPYKNPYEPLPTLWMVLLQSHPLFVRPRLYAISPAQHSRWPPSSKCFWMDRGISKPLDMRNVRRR